MLMDLVILEESFYLGFGGQRLFKVILLFNLKQLDLSIPFPPIQFNGTVITH